MAAPEESGAKKIQNNGPRRIPEAREAQKRLSKEK
jgi:hypothetical protein